MKGWSLIYLNYKIDCAYKKDGRLYLYKQNTITDKFFDI